MRTRADQGIERCWVLKLGHGFAFVGRQYHVEGGGDDFYIDLLFFNWPQSRFVVELEIGRFEPEHAGKLGFYVAWVDDNLRVPDRHSPTIGILLCARRNDHVVRYSLVGSTAPLAVAGYTYDALPPGRPGRRPHRHRSPRRRRRLPHRTHLRRNISL